MTHPIHMTIPTVGTVYKHYKGNLYKIRAIARDATTLEMFVVYEGLYDCEHFGSHPVWIRGLNEFMEHIQKDGVEIPRFMFLAESPSLPTQSLV